MSSRIRFSTARHVFEAFPDLTQVVPAPGDESAPIDYARQLLGSPNRAQAVAFLCYLLPRREAVWWARQCVSAILGPKTEHDPALQAADNWVRAPEEENRQAALAAGAAGDQHRATTWLALAAAWSGGSMCPPDAPPMPVPPSLMVAPPWACAKAVNAAIVIAMVGDPSAINDRLKACAEAGIRFAEGGDARPAIAPTRRN
jgi:hypothetical protein